MSQSLKRDFVWNTVGVLLQNVLSPLLIIVITRLNGIQDSGLFSFAFSIAMIFWTISMWGGRTYQVSDATREFRQLSYVVVRLILGSLALIGAFVFIMLNDYNVTMMAIIMSLVILKVIESVADSLYGIIQINGKLYLTGKSLIYKAVFGFSAFLAVDLMTDSILMGCIALVVVNVIVLLLYDLPKAKHLHSGDKSSSVFTGYVSQALTIIRRCSAVAAVAFLASFPLNIPRYFLEIYSPEELGYFGILAMPTTLIILVMSFILQPNVVRLTTLYANKNLKEFDKLIMSISRTTIMLGTFILLGAALLGVPVLSLVFGVDFSRYQMALLLIVLGGVFSAVIAIFMNILTITRNFKWQFYVLVFTNIVLGVVALPAVLNGGLDGGIIAFTIVSGVQAGLMFMIYKGVLRSKP